MSLNGKQNTERKIRSRKVRAPSWFQMKLGQHVMANPDELLLGGSWKWDGKKRVRTVTRRFRNFIRNVLEYDDGSRLVVRTYFDGRKTTMQFWEK